MDVVTLRRSNNCILYRKTITIYVTCFVVVTEIRVPVSVVKYTYVSGTLVTVLKSDRQQVYRSEG